MSLLDATRRQVHKDNTNWYRKAIAINIYHQAQIELNNKHTYTQTALDLSLSKTYVCESINLAELISIEPDVIHLPRYKALQRLRSKD